MLRLQKMQKKSRNGIYSKKLYAEGMNADEILTKILENPIMNKHSKGSLPVLGGMSGSALICRSQIDHGQLQPSVVNHKLVTVMIWVEEVV